MIDIRPYAMFLLVFVSAFGTYGQTVKESTISWVSERSTDLKTRQDRESGCHFKSFGTDKIEFTQGTGVRTLTVVRTEGKWADVNIPGKIVYIVSYGTLKGKLTFEKSAEETSATLDFTDGSENGLKKKYTISSIQVH